MEKRDEKRGGWGGAIAGIVIAIPLLIVLYILSAGPATWLVQRDYLSADLAQAIYYPLLWVIGRSGWGLEAWNWYTGLWAAAA